MYIIYYKSIDYIKKMAYNFFIIYIIIIFFYILQQYLINTFYKY